MKKIYPSNYSLNPDRVVETIVVLPVRTIEIEEKIVVEVVVAIAVEIVEIVEVVAIVEIVEVVAIVEIVEIA